MDRLRQFMQGRNGVDGLTYAMIILYWPFAVAARYSGIRLLEYPGMIILFTAIFRIFSKNVVKRRLENRKFLKILYAVTNPFTKKKRAVPTHSLFKCPSCSQAIRVPAGLGTIRIRCPKCRAKFTRDT